MTDEETPKVPGLTCPQIDKAQHVMRKLVWRLQHREGTPPDEISALLREGLAALEEVRAENVAMRAAHTYMQRKTRIMERVIGALGGG